MTDDHVPYYNGPRPLKPLTVGEFIAYLQTKPQDMLVAHRCCSEDVLLEIDEIEILEACPPRPDGWIQSARPDKPTQKYLRLPGN